MILLFYYFICCYISYFAVLEYLLFVLFNNFCALTSTKLTFAVTLEKKM